MTAFTRPVQCSLTPRQSTCLHVIKTHIAKHGHAPSRAEIASQMGLKSKSQVNLLLGSLQARGWVKLEKYATRAITVYDPQSINELSPDVEQALQAHCMRTGDSRADIINDAVSLFLDGFTQADAH